MADKDTNVPGKKAYISLEEAEAAMIALRQEDIEAFGMVIPECFPSTSAIEALNKIPAADVRPVIRAHWKWDENGMDWNLGAWKCSHCHCKAETWWATDKHNPLNCAGSHFCGNCGADMREGRNDSYGGNHDRV